MQSTEIEDTAKTEIPLGPHKDGHEKSKFFTDGGLFWFMLIFGIFFVTVIFVFQTILVPVSILGTSMQPTINQSVIGEKDNVHSDIVYCMKKNSYYNNDIVVINNPTYKYINSEEVNLLIKRVVAKPNQTIRFFVTENHPNDKLKLYYDIVVLDSNGADINLDQSYLSGEMFYTLTKVEDYSIHYPFFNIIFSALTKSGVYELKIPENCYFVMGDNRNNSEDSRFFGLVDAEDLFGRVELIVPYGRTILSSIWRKLFGMKMLPANFLLMR